MPYHLDFQELRLDFLKKRLLEEELIPSLLPLRERLADHLQRLGAAGIKTLADLGRALGKDAPLKALSKVSGVPADYLKLLGRAIRGYAPKPAALAEYPGVGAPTAAKLERAGIKDSRALYDAGCRPRDRDRLAEKTGIDKRTVRELTCLADLSRIQWVSPIFARLLHDAGFTTTRAVSRASAEDLFVRVDSLNKEKKLFKGKIGRRDMKRLVYLASLLSYDLKS